MVCHEELDKSFKGVFLTQIQLRDMTIYESSPLQDDQLVPAPRSQELRRVLEATPLRFSYQDGVVAELCPDNREDGWALNVKRGVLSALQNSMERLEGSETVQEVGGILADYTITPTFLLPCFTSPCQLFPLYGSGPVLASCQENEMSGNDLGMSL